MSGFDPGSFFRKEWGTPSQDDAKATDQEIGIASQQAINLDTLEAVIGTASPVTRWRQAHPDQAGTEKDVVKMIRGQIARLLHEAGVPPGEERVKVRVTGVLLMVKRVEDGHRVSS